MNISKPGFTILTPIDGNAILKKNIELIGRVCYKSESNIAPDSAAAFVRNIIASGHESVLEHHSFSVRFICDRGVSYELVRHRLAAFSQESIRYCNYSKAGFGSEITVIAPSYLEPHSAGYGAWEVACRQAEKAYFNLLDFGCTAQEARAVLPTCLKTEIIMTANIREWRHILKLRTSIDAHPQMRELMIPLLAELQKKIPVLFDDIKPGCSKKNETKNTGWTMLMDRLPTADDADANSRIMAYHIAGISEVETFCDIGIFPLEYVMQHLGAFVAWKSIPKDAFK